MGKTPKGTTRGEKKTKEDLFGKKKKKKKTWGGTSLSKKKGKITRGGER